MLKLKIRDEVFDKLDGYDPIKINDELFVVKHIQQIDSDTAKMEIIATNHKGIETLGNQYQVKAEFVEVEILGPSKFADLVMFNQFDDLITKLSPSDYDKFLQNVIDFGRMFDKAQYRVIQIAANQVLSRLFRMAIEP